MTLLDQLWETYAAQVPYARTFVQLAEGQFRNDHVAFRSLDLRPIARVFEELGWKRAGEYDFPETHLNAIHLSKPGEPRVFVSELRVADLSPRAREILAQLPADSPYDGSAGLIRGLSFASQPPSAGWRMPPRWTNEVCMKYWPCSCAPWVELIERISASRGISLARRGKCFLRSSSPVGIEPISTRFFRVVKPRSSG